MARSKALHGGVDTRWRSDGTLSPSCISTELTAEMTISSRDCTPVMIKSVRLTVCSVGIMYDSPNIFVAAATLTLISPPRYRAACPAIPIVCVSGYCKIVSKIHKGEVSMGEKADDPRYQLALAFKFDSLC